MAESDASSMSTAFETLSNDAKNIKKAENVALLDVLSLAESSIDNLRTILSSIDSRIYTEFREIAQYIANTKSEIGQLQANDLRNQRIPDAGRELNAVVEATEDATNRIMECAETIMTADPSDHATYHQTVNDNIMAIFEACSFQDITGQRLSKVVETLEFIDKRVNKFAEAIGVTDTDGPIDEEEAERDKRKQEQILHGPQHEGEGVNQDDIDSMFG